MGDHMRTSLVCQAIDMAVRRCPVEEGVTFFHSDRGSQCTSQRFLDHLRSYGIRPSVGRTGVCWDNAWAESFNATLKNERVHRMVYPTKDKAIKDTGCLVSRCPRGVFGASCRNARQVEGWLGGFPDSYAFVDVGQDAWDLGEAGAGRSFPWPGG